MTQYKIDQICNVWHKVSLPLGEIREGSQNEQGNDISVDREHEAVGAIAESRLAEDDEAGIAELRKGKSKRNRASPI